MKLVFYSGGLEKENQLLDKAFQELLGKKNPVVTFIPSSSYLSQQEFKNFVKHYSKFKITRFIHFPVDVPFDRIIFQEVMKSDAIHMAGGNTFYFLNSLRKANMIPALRKFVEKGGVLSGLSAGAILMTENIEMAGYPDFDRDENNVNIKNLSSIGLVNFAFFRTLKILPGTTPSLSVTAESKRKSSMLVPMVPESSSMAKRRAFWALALLTPTE
jgi:dipeptidase E